MPRPGPVTVVVFNPDEAQTYARLIRAPRGRVRVRTAATVSEALQYVEEMDVLYTWGFPPKLLPNANRLRWIQVMGAGVDAVLDVFVDEPLQAEHPFWDLPNVVVTPHVSGPNDPAEIAPVFNDNLARWLAGRPLRHVVDRVRGY